MIDVLAYSEPMDGLALPNTALGAWHGRGLVPVYNEPMSGGEGVKPAAPGVKLTYEDFLLFPDDGKRHELIDGEHYVAATPNTKHQTIVMNLLPGLTLPLSKIFED